MTDNSTIKAILGAAPLTAFTVLYFLALFRLKEDRIQLFKDVQAQLKWLMGGCTVASIVASISAVWS